MRSTLKPKGLSDSFEQDHNHIFNAKMVLSLTSVDDFDRVESLNPDIIELRPAVSACYHHPEEYT